MPSLRGTTQLSDKLRFSGLDLICPINPDEVANRWINTFVPTPGQIVKAYSPGVSSFMYRVLRSYVKMSMRGREIPPFIHPLQMELDSSAPLSSCLSLIQTHHTPLPRSDRLLTTILQDQMTSIHEQHTRVDHIALLAGFQAYLMYAMVLFFELGGGNNPYLRQAMMNLQEIACASCRQGLSSMAEQRGSRPEWEAWVVTEAKRRTLYTMCMFDSILLTHDGLQTYLATELRGLLAPSSKRLWESQNRSDWEAIYDAFFDKYDGYTLAIDELWPIPSHFSDAEILDRRSRVDAWLEEVDEYGMMVFATTSCTHGG